MKIQKPLPHWNNFQVSELTKILEHCKALEKLGIAQDEEMIFSIERDIILRKKQYAHSGSRLTKMEHQTIKQNLNKPNKNVGKTAQHSKQKSQDYLLEQTI